MSPYCLLSFGPYLRLKQTTVNCGTEEGYIKQEMTPFKESAPLDFKVWSSISYLQPTQQMTRFYYRAFPQDNFNANHIHLLWKEKKKKTSQNAELSGSKYNN